MIKGDAIEGLQARAPVTGYDQMEAIAVPDHARLGWRWCSDSVAWSRRRGRPSCRYGTTDDAHTEMRVEPKTVAIRSDGRVPRHELVQGDAIPRLDVRAAIARDDEVEPVAVADHTFLSGRGRLDAIPCAGRSGSRRGGGRGAADRRLAPVLLDAV